MGLAQDTSPADDGTALCLHFTSPVCDLPGLGPKRAALLQQLNIECVGDLLFHLPRDYADRRSVQSISTAVDGAEVIVSGEVIASRIVHLRGRRNLAEVTIRDDTGEIKATWFGRGFLAKSLIQGTVVLLSGTVGKYKGLALKNPEFEILSGKDEDQLNVGRIVPIYRLSEGIGQRMLRKWVHLALSDLNDPGETLPESLRDRYDFPEIGIALQNVHYPDSLEDAQRARDRFAYEELLAIQLAVLRARVRRHESNRGYIHVTEGGKLEALRGSLPFTLGAAQVRATDDILRDMASSRPMARLLQGDVGCGKTVVALHAIAAAADGGFQSALMAPTELLAEQHHSTMRAYLEPLGLNVLLLTGSSASAREIREAVALGTAHVIVGTHALFQEKTRFHNLGLVIIDEQHRFGVVQRGRLTGKGSWPDALHMSATPIPRTLAMTVYGSMDVSVIDELPPGRRPVITRHMRKSDLPELYEFVRAQAALGFQAFCICPLIEESETRPVRAVKRHYEELSTGVWADLRCALVHGKTPAGERETVMAAFLSGEIDVLFSTTVIEVGLDVPTATTMIIEDAAQFGLTQLHQLRGRIGRGTQQSSCFLLGEASTEDGRRRLEVMLETSDGFVIAEEDLKLRGPGEFHGVRQTGLSDMRVADLIRDVRLLDHAHRDAREIMSRDNDLQAPEWSSLLARASSFEDLVL